MDWIKLSISTTTEGIEPVCAVLINSGVTGMEIEDTKDFHNFLDNNKDKWDYVDEELLKSHANGTFVNFYVTDNACGADMRASVTDGLMALSVIDEDNEYGSLEVFASGIKEEDWAENWKQYFKPLNVGDKILILPEWESLDKPTDRTVFTVNPGMSFGTGSHHTTQLCIKELEKYIKKDMKVLDLGCGSGILSIIALLLGANDASAIDIDPNAVEIAVKNAERNGVSTDNYHTFSGNIVTDTDLHSKISQKKYDIVLANIVADVIIGMKPLIYDFLSDNGIFITSGIIKDRKEDVLTAYNATGLKLISEAQQGDWICLTYKK